MTEGLQIPRHGSEDPVENFYDVKEELGRGSFSTVFKCVRKSDHKDFAMKVIQKATLGQKKMEMVEIEIEILKRVNHPNVIKLEEIFENPQQVQLILELITGGELFDKIVELQSYSEKDAAALVQQVISAVGHLHDINIVHRDLKPENLLLSSKMPDARIKLADFGLSTICIPGEKLTKAVGTPGYIAPEVIQTLDEEIDGYQKEVDMWSIGVITYILLCGFPPFYAEDDDEAFDQIVAGEFEFPDPYWTNISTQAKDFIKHLLIVDAHKRATAKQALDHPWIKANNVDQHLGSTLEQLKKFNAKKRWKKSITTVIALGRFQWATNRKSKKSKEAKEKKSKE